MMPWKERRSNGPTAKWTDKASYRVAGPHLTRNGTRSSRPIRCDVWIVERMRYPTNQQTDRHSQLQRCFVIIKIFAPPHYLSRVRGYSLHLLCEAPKRCRIVVQRPQRPIETTTISRQQHGLTYRLNSYHDGTDIDLYRQDIEVPSLTPHSLNSQQSRKLVVVNVN